MASCTTKKWGNDYSPQIQLEVTATSSGSTTSLEYSLYYIAEYAASSSVGKNWSVSFDGTVGDSGTYSINGKTGKNLIKSGSVSVTRSKENRSLSFSLSFDINLTWAGVYKGNLSASGSITIPKLDSYTISYNANGGSSAPSSQSKWYGESIKISESEPTRTGYTFAGWGTSASDTSVNYNPGDSYTANASATLYAIWTANTYSVKFNANGGSGAPSTQTKTYGVDLTLSSTVPTRANYTFVGWGTSAGSTTASYSAGGKYTKNANVTLYAVWSLSYTKPRITSVLIFRSNASGQASDDGTYITFSFKWATDKSVTGISVGYKLNTAPSYTNTSVSASGTSGTVSKTVGGSLSTLSLYDVRIVVSDSGGSQTYTSMIRGKMFAMRYLYSDGQYGVAFGKNAELIGYADFDLNMRFRKKAIINNEIAYSGLGPDGSEMRIARVTASGNIAIGTGTYDAQEGQTILEGFDIAIKTYSTGDSIKPYFRSGDSLTLDIATAGYVTSSGTQVHFFVPLSRPCLGNPVISISSTDGLCLRQNGKYTHGSNASLYIHPDSYEGSQANGSTVTGVRVCAVFSDVTNVVNNDSIGIRWKGKITFS